MNAGHNALKLQEPDRGIARGERAVITLEYLSQRWPTVRSYHGNLGGALSNLASILSSQEQDLERAERLANNAIKEQCLALETPDDINGFLLKHHLVLATLQTQLGRWSQVRATCDAGLQFAQKMKERYPTAPDTSYAVDEFQQMLDNARQCE